MSDTYIITFDDGSKEIIRAAEVTMTETRIRFAGITDHVPNIESLWLNILHVRSVATQKDGPT